MRVLLFLRLPELRLGRGWLGWEAAGWSQQPLAGLMKSPGRLARSLAEFWNLQVRHRSPRAGLDCGGFGVIHQSPRSVCQSSGVGSAIFGRSRHKNGV